MSEDNTKFSDIQKKNLDRLERVEVMMSSLRNEVRIVNKNVNTLLDLLVKSGAMSQDLRNNHFIK